MRPPVFADPKVRISIVDRHINTLNEVHFLHLLPWRSNALRNKAHNPSKGLPKLARQAAMLAGIYIHQLIARTADRRVMKAIIPREINQANDSNLPIGVLRS